MSGAAEKLAEIDRATSRDLALIAARQGKEPAMFPESSKVRAIVDSLRVLESMRVPCALIGGLAVGIHSETPRATLDVDLAVPSAVEVDALVAALVAAGFRLTGRFPHSLNFRHPSGEPVQLALDPSFDPMIDRAERFLLGDTTVPLVTRADLLAMKERAAADPARRASKRLRDRADIELLRGELPDPDEGW